jgi:hypothetical protein
MDKSTADYPRYRIPRSDLLGVVTAQEFSSAIREEGRRIGFTGEMEPE